MARKSRKNKNIDDYSDVSITQASYKAALYIRLSVEDNKKRGDSVESQKSIMQDFVNGEADISIFDFYIDNGYTGTNFTRPAFEKMLKDIEEKKVNCVICKDLSRLGRSVIDTGFYIENYFPLNNVRFISINDNFDSNASNVTDIMLPIMNMMNEAYSLDISRKIKAQQKQSMSDGEFIGSRAPYGYKKSPDDCHKLIINEETAPIVRQIFKWRAEGIAYNEIVRMLNRQGILSPGKYAQSVGIFNNEKLIGRGEWSASSVKKILADEVYLGNMVQGKTKSLLRKQLDVQKSDWIRVYNTHEAIIDKEVFEIVQGRKSKISKEVKLSKKTSYAPNIFRGKIFCDHCGRVMYRGILHKEVFVHRCHTNYTSGIKNCVGMNIKEDTLISLLREKLLKRNHHYFEVGENAHDKMNSLVEEKSRKLSSEILIYKEEIEKNKNFGKSLYESLIKEVISADEYSDMKIFYENKISAISEKISELEIQLSELDIEASRNNNVYESIDKVINGGEINSDFLEMLVKKIIVTDKEEIKVEFRIEAGNEEASING